MRKILFLLCTAMLAACTSTGSRYDSIYLHDFTIDDMDADEKLWEMASERLAETGLSILSADEAHALTPKQRMSTLKVDISIDIRSRKVDADIDIENYQTDRDLYDKTCKENLDEPDAMERALDRALTKGVEWINRQSRQK